VKLLTFLAARFAWRPHARTLPGEAEAPPSGEAAEAVVAFVHAEGRDFEEAARERTLRHATKHVQWLAGKRGAREVVLHSFTHLGGAPADPAMAEAWMGDLRAKLERKGFRVQTTPFGWTCAWTLEVHGESIAKVWKEIGAGEGEA
jgi:hypothetical protein